MPTFGIRKPRRSSKLRTWLVIDSVGTIVGILPAFMAMALSVPGSPDDRWMTKIYLFALGSWPWVVMASPVLAWAAYGWRREPLAWRITFAPIVWLALTMTLGFAAF